MACLSDHRVRRTLTLHDSVVAQAWLPGTQRPQWAKGRACGRSFAQRLAVRLTGIGADQLDISARIRPRRTITGMAAVLLPYTEEVEIDWASFEAHVVRTVEAGLVPAVNMDTGYVQLLSDAERRRVLEVTAALTGGGFVAGAYVADAPGDGFNVGAHAAAAAAVAEHGGTPVVFPSHG